MSLGVMTTFEQILEHCVGLRRQFERDEASFFLGLVAVETECMDVLRRSGVETFESFLHSSNHKRTLVRPDRYRAFANGLKHTTPEEAERLGAPAVIELGRSVHDESNVAEYKRRVIDWSEARHGLVPTQQTAMKLLIDADPRPRVSESTRRANEMNKLRDENAALKREVKRLKVMVAKLEKELELEKV